METAYNNSTINGARRLLMQKAGARPPAPDFTQNKSHAGKTGKKTIIAKIAEIFK